MGGIDRELDIRREYPLNGDFFGMRSFSCYFLQFCLQYLLSIQFGSFLLAGRFSETEYAPSPSNIGSFPSFATFVRPFSKAIWAIGGQCPLSSNHRHSIPPPSIPFIFVCLSPLWPRPFTRQSNKAQSPIPLPTSTLRSLCANGHRTSHRHFTIIQFGHSIQFFRVKST